MSFALYGRHYSENTLLFLLVRENLKQNYVLVKVPFIFPAFDIIDIISLSFT